MHFRRVFSLYVSFASCLCKLIEFWNLRRATCFSVRVSAGPPSWALGLSRMPRPPDPDRVVFSGLSTSGPQDLSRPTGRPNFAAHFMYAAKFMLDNSHLIIHLHAPAARPAVCPQRT